MSETLLFFFRHTSGSFFFDHDLSCYPQDVLQRPSVDQDDSEFPPVAPHKRHAASVIFIAPLVLRMCPCLQLIVLCCSPCSVAAIFASVLNAPRDDDCHHACGGFLELISLSFGILILFHFPPPRLEVCTNPFSFPLLAPGSSPRNMIDAELGLTRQTT